MSTKRGTSAILISSECLLRKVYNSIQKPSQDPMNILIHKMASRILYETTAQILWLDTEYEYAMNSRKPGTPYIGDVLSGLKETRESLQARCVLLNAMEDRPPSGEMASFIDRLWFEPDLAMDVQQSQSWERGTESYVRTLERNKKSTHMPDLLGLQLGLVKENETNKCSMTEWLLNFDKSTRDGQSMKQLNTEASSLGKELCLFSATLLFDISDNSTLLDEFRKWRVSLSTLVWQRGKLRADIVCLTKVVEALQFAEIQVKEGRRADHQHKLEIKAGKGKIPSKSKKKKLSNTLTKGQLQCKRKEIGEALGKVKSALVRLEISLTEPIWLKRAINHTDLVSGCVRPFLTQCRKDLQGLKAKLLPTSVTNVSVGLICTTKKIEEIWRENESTELEA